MTSDLRFAVVGCGVIGRAHVEAIASTGGATLAALCDLEADSEAIRALADTHGVPLFDDIGTMLRCAPLDVVNICTPSGLHQSQACQAMRHGCNVLVEKPMAMSVEGHRDMLRVQSEAEVKLSVVSQHRFDPAYVNLKHLTEAGAFGRLVMGLCVVPWWRSAGYYMSGDWRGTLDQDGGVLMNQAIHSIDLLQWLMGPVDRVTGLAATLAHDIEVEDTAAAALHFRSGALGVASATTGAYPGGATRLEIFGDEGPRA